MPEWPEDQNCKIPCIICGKQLRNFDEDGNQPMTGTSFTSHGHYGSTLFDSMDGTYLEINFCDPCLDAAREKQAVLHCREMRQPKLRSYAPWSKLHDAEQI